MIKFQEVVYNELNVPTILPVVHEMFGEEPLRNGHLFGYGKERWEVCGVMRTHGFAVYTCHRIPEKATHRSNKGNITGVYYYIDGVDVYRWSQSWPAWNFVGTGKGFIEELGDFPFTSSDL